MVRDMGLDSHFLDVSDMESFATCDISLFLNLTSDKGHRGHEIESFK